MNDRMGNSVHFFPLILSCALFLLFQELLGECSEAPHVNQIEVQPHFQNKELVSFCTANDIHVTAYREDII